MGGEIRIMPIFDTEIRVNIEVAYFFEDGQIIVDAVLVSGTGARLPLTDKMAERIVELCREDQLEG